MSILQGTLTVVVATVIASGMIVLTGTSSAEDKGKTEADAGNLVSSKKTNGMSKKLTEIEKQADEIVSKASISAVKNIPLAPPPGPFLNKDAAVISAKKSLLAPIEPIAPKPPVKLSKQPEQRANSLHFKSAPSLSHKVLEPKADLKKPIASTDFPIAPKLSKSAPKVDQKMAPVYPSDKTPKQATMPRSKAIANTAPVAPSPPKNIVEQPKMKSIDRPIWVQDGKVLKQGLNPSSRTTTLQNQAGKAMPSMGENNNYPSQQYIYVPVPMMPSNMSPPQMPMFNGNINPPANYWGGGIPSNNAPNIAIQKKSTGSMSAPMQKSNK